MVKRRRPAGSATVPSDAAAGGDGGRRKRRRVATGVEAVSPAAAAAPAAAPAAAAPTPTSASASSVEEDRCSWALVVGDGDLAFAAALSAQQRVCGTVLPSEREHRQLYGSLTERNAATIRRNSGQCFFGVDATKLGSDKRLTGRNFEEVFFNFPHLGYSQQAERGGTWSRAKQHLSFFADLFASLATVQQAGGLMHLTLTPTPPYSIKEVKATALDKGYAFVSETSFNPADYPGYRPVWGDARDTIKGGTAQYGQVGRRFTFKNCCCGPCGVVCKGEEQLRQHLAGRAHGQRLRAARRSSVTPAAAAAAPAEEGGRGSRMQAEGAPAVAGRASAAPPAPAAPRRGEPPQRLRPLRRRRVVLV
eukprot:TRINITY_DN14408_c0_g1_i4.p1 TRINITY_DN14408_c0_g1~~TRINITY_DN14408_c0_g1_i4.p1  ORF type:complete len:392 (+),score=61.77 TRINITY_DN14408_c0_g1_i4:89-1177(+)